MAALLKRLRELCSPAYLYFVISMLGLIMIIIQNIGNTHHLSFGSFSARVPNTTLIFIVKIIYILFWTWILNLICKSGYTSISWALVLIPFFLFFVIMTMVMMQSNEGIITRRNR